MTRGSDIEVALLVDLPLDELVPAVEGDGGGAESPNVGDNVVQLSITEAVTELFVDISQFFKAKLTLAIDVEQVECVVSSFLGVGVALTKA
jgi:hypothetical protein